MGRIAELQGVKLVVDVPEHGLRKGEIGTGVFVFETPHLAYEVEFVDQQGRTKAQLPLLPEQVEPVDGTAPPL